MRSTLGFDVLAAVVAVAMLARNLPRLLRIRRAPAERAPLVPAVNVVLAAAILAYAMKGILGRLI